MKSLSNLIKQQPDIDKIKLFAKDPYKNIIFLLTKGKVHAQSILMILKLLLNTRIIWKTFIKTLKNTTQIKNVKY